MYSYARSRRADGTESIVISAPLHLVEKQNQITPNFIGIAQLMTIAELVKSIILFQRISFVFKFNSCFQKKAKPYWAKDLVFIVSDMGQIGIQAWINSYYDIKAEC